MFSSPKEKWLSDPPDGALMTEAEREEYRSWFQGLPLEDRDRIFSLRLQKFLEKNPLSQLGDGRDFHVGYTPQEAEALITEIRKGRQTAFSLDNGVTCTVYTREEYIELIRRNIAK